MKYPISQLDLDAHRLLHLAAERGRTTVVMERLFVAYHSDLSNIADRTLLTNLATEAGLDRAELTESWGADAFADAVRAEHATRVRSGRDRGPRLPHR